MRPSNHLDETKTQHTYSREGGYQPAEGEYDPAANQYPKATKYGVARDAEHEAQLIADHEAGEEPEPVITSPVTNQLGETVHVEQPKPTAEEPESEKAE